VSVGEEEEGEEIYACMHAGNRALDKGKGGRGETRATHPRLEGSSHPGQTKA